MIIAKFDKYYTNNPKKFIDIISKNKEVLDAEFDYYLKTNTKIFVKCANPKKIMDLHLCFYKRRYAKLVIEKIMRGVI